MKISELLSEYTGKNEKRIEDGMYWDQVEDYVWMDDVASAHGIDIDDDDAGDFRLNDWFKDALRNEMKMAHDMIMGKFKNGRISISREISADKWKPKLSMGVYWSHGRAHAYGADPSHHRWYLFKTSVTEDMIDWGATLWKNGHWALWEEEEIQLLKGVPLKIERMYVQAGAGTGERNLIDPVMYKDYVGKA